MKCKDNNTPPTSIEFVVYVVAGARNCKDQKMLVIKCVTSSFKQLQNDNHKKQTNYRE